MVDRGNERLWNDYTGRNISFPFLTSTGSALAVFNPVSSASPQTQGQPLRQRSRDREKDRQRQKKRERERGRERLLTERTDTSAFSLSSFVLQVVRDRGSGS